jgi:hypothetical protein
MLLSTPFFSAVFQGSPVDEFMPLPADIRNFGAYDDEEGAVENPARRADMFLHVESNLVPDFLSEAAVDGAKPSLARRRTFEIIEPVDDDLERPVVDECVVYSESEDEENVIDVSPVLLEPDRFGERPREPKLMSEHVDVDDLESGGGETKDLTTVCLDIT